MLASGESYIRIEKDTSFILSIVILILIMESLHKIWSRYFGYNWKFGLALILLFGVPRFILVLDANMSGGYGTAFIIFFIMWFTPFIFLTRKGRREIGLSVLTVTFVCFILLPWAHWRAVLYTGCFIFCMATQSAIRLSISLKPARLSC